MSWCSTVVCTCGYINIRIIYVQRACVKRGGADRDSIFGIQIAGFISFIFFFFLFLCNQCCPRAVVLLYNRRSCIVSVLYCKERKRDRD